MKKGLKIFLIICIGSVVCIVLYGTIRLINSFALIGRGEPHYIYKNAYEYIDMNASDTEQLQFGYVAELDGDLYYIHPGDYLLYGKNNSGQDIQFSHNQMDRMMLVNDYIIFSYEQELMVQNRETDEVIKISELYKHSMSQTIYINDLLLYINEKKQLCSYDLKNRKSKILSFNTHGFKVYGDFIFYEVSIDDFFGTGCYDGSYAMDFDGGNQNRITDAGAWDFDIYQNYIFITNDTNKIYRIDMQSSTFIEFPVYISSLEFQLANEHIYYTTSDDIDGDNYNEYMFVEVDLSGNVTQKIQMAEFKDKCWAEYNSEQVYLIYVENKADSTVRILNKDGEIVNEIVYENSVIDEFVCLPNYIVVRATENDKVITYVYDEDYNELNKF